MKDLKYLQHVAGWEGVNCDVDEDDCASSPCQNGGRCEDAFHSFTCACPDGFTGKSTLLDKLKKYIFISKLIKSMHIFDV